MNATNPALRVTEQQDHEHRATITELRDHMNRNIVGQSAFVERLLIGLVADGHLLLEGAPGLAKTKAVKIWRPKSACCCDAWCCASTSATIWPRHMATTGSPF
jgi:hypothetical protein